MKSAGIQTIPFFLNGCGEMKKLMREKDWNATSLGPPEYWPRTLQIMLGVILNSKFPMFIWWGPDLICFYNDAYRPSLGKEGKHPAILGQTAVQAWPEIWDIISPLIQQVLEKGEATWSEDQLIPIYRNSSIEDVYWTFSYSPIHDENGTPGGVLVTCVETTEKILNRQRLEQSMDLLRFATEAAELGTWDYNPQTNTFLGNDQLKKWFGISTNDETDLSIAIEAVAEEDRQRVLNAMAATMDFEKQVPFNIEFTVTNASTGKEMVAEARGRAYFDDKGRPYRFSGTMEDITLKDEARRLLTESEKNLRNLVEQAPVAMCVLKGQQHTVEIVNDRMLNLWGKERDAVMHLPVLTALPEVEGQGLEPLLDHVYKTGERFTAHERPVQLLRNNQLETIYQNFVYEPLLGIHGEVEGVIAVTTDVTEQVIARQLLEDAEERARLATESAKLGTFDFNIPQKLAVTSPRFREIFDIDEHVSHSAILDRFHPEDRPIRDRAHDAALKTRHLAYEARVVKQDGSLTWVRIDGRVLVDDAGNPNRIVGTALDITEARELEQKREEYIAIASHELRNPITSLKLTLELLAELIPNGGHRVLLDKSREQAKRLIAMTSELLNVSKIASGVLDLKPEIISLSQCIADSITTAQAGVNQNPITIEGDVDVNIRADKFRIEQVLVNLLSNASKYSPKGSPINVHVKVMTDIVRVSVIDKGIGIAADKLSRVFKKFSRIETDSTVKGHGLGLYISDQIIRNHGGEMGVDSRKGEGSVFWFTLPH